MQPTSSTGIRQPGVLHKLRQAVSPERADLAAAIGVDRAPAYVPLVADGHGGLCALLQMLGGGDVAEVSAVDIPVPMRRLREGETLYHEGAWADAIYFVRAGTFKTFSTGYDGYEQVLGFFGPRDLLGFDAIGMGRYSNQTVALEESSVCVVLLHDFFCMPARSAGLDRAVFGAVSAAMRQRGEMADMMGAVAAEVRLARFLLQLSRRMRQCGQSSSRFHLRMSRRDIASYLGIAHETVSRAFSTLVHMGLVSVDNREVAIVDMDGLRALSQATRRPCDENERSVADHRSDRNRGAAALAGRVGRGAVAA
jgi:CRP/FNR family transcriptional regulator, anaerobic regulatory protein